MKTKHKNRPTEAESLFRAIEETKRELSTADAGFSAAVDETLIDSYSYEILSLQKKYDYYIRLAKEMGLSKHRI